MQLCGVACHCVAFAIGREIMIYLFTRIGVLWLLLVVIEWNPLILIQLHMLQTTRMEFIMEHLMNKSRMGVHLTTFQVGVHTDTSRVGVSTDISRVGTTMYSIDNAVNPISSTIHTNVEYYSWMFWQLCKDSYHCASPSLCGGQANPGVIPTFNGLFHLWNI